jgi:sulfate permease, SulP family
VVPQRRGRRPLQRRLALIEQAAVGLVLGAMLVVMSISVASLVFSGGLVPSLASGIGFVLWGTMAHTLAATWFATLPGTAAVSQSAPGAVVAVAAAGLVAALPDAATPQTIALTVAAFVALTTLLVATTFLLAGRLRLGRFVRYIPYPVVGGFIAGTGWLLVSGGIRAMTGLPVTVDALSRLTTPSAVAQWLPGLLLGVLLILTRRVRHPLALPLTLATTTAAFYLVAGLRGVELEDWRARGLLLGPFPAVDLRPLLPVDLSPVAWEVVATGAAGAATVTFVSLLSLLFNVTAIEHALGRKLDIDRELTAAGLGNLASGLAGGTPGYQALSLTLLNRGLAGAQRVSGSVAALVVALGLLLGVDLLEAIPTMLVGGVLVYLGLTFLVDWLVLSTSALTRIEYGIVVAILAATMAFGFVPAVALGLALTVVLFVASYSRVDAARHVLSGVEARSRVSWAPHQQRLLEARGEHLLVLQLHGFLFFGSANRLVERLERRLAAPPPLRFVVLDLQEVSGMDATAAAALAGLPRRMGDVTLILSSLAPEARTQLARSGLPDDAETAATLDEALERCERALLADAGERPEQAVEERLSLWEEQDVELHALLGHLERQVAPAGATIVRQGDAADALYLLADGRLTALLDRRGEASVRLEQLHAGTLVGEIGFYTGAPRSATVVADVDSIVYRLDRERLEALERDDPQLAGAVHRFVASRLAARATHLQRLVTALLR